MSELNDAQRRTLWHTAWGVAVAASAAFAIGYGASHFADPSVGAKRTPAWPLFVAIAVALASVWFLLAPELHRGRFAARSNGAHSHDEVLTGELSEDGEPASIGTFRIEAPAPPDDPHG